MGKRMIKVLFVCMGNICRSPAGEGVFKQLIQKNNLEDQVYVESCGLGDWHIGHSPDSRMLEVSKARGILLSSRAQQIKRQHLEEFDYILAADKKVYHVLIQSADESQKAKIKMMTAYSELYFDKDVPDPYSLNDQAFELVMDMLEDSCEGLIQHLSRRNEQREKEYLEDR